MSTKASRVSKVIERLLVLTPLLVEAGCGAGFDSPDLVKSLRVLGVQKDHPYAAPTVDAANPSLVNLTMLDYDSRKGGADVQHLWFSGCDDLPGDQYFTCLAYMNLLWKKWQLYSTGRPEKVLEEQEKKDWSPGDPGVFSDTDVIKFVSDILKIITGVAAEVTAEEARAFLANFRIGVGERFTYRVPLGIIENHRAKTDPNIPPFGLSFIFFTVCAGHIETAPKWQNVDITATLRDATLGFPFVCVDDDGTEKGPDDFVAGYTQLFVYGDGTANKNPVIDGVSFKGEDVVAIADAGTIADADSGTIAEADAGTIANVDAGAAAPAGTPRFCIDGSCVPSSLASDPCANPQSLRVPACSGKCPTYNFNPTMNAAFNNDVDVFASKERGANVGEQMWINYYTDKGSLKHAVKLLRDASQGWSADDPNLGWSGDHSNTWTPPADAGPANLWAVAHDSRGGTAWVWLQVCVF